MKEIGDILKAKRLENKLSVEDACAATKIRGRYVEGLEAGDIGIFAAEMYYIAFLRSYAKFLGLDDNALVKKYQDSKNAELEKKDFIDSVSPVKYDNSKLLICIILFLAMLGGFIYLNSARSGAQDDGMASDGSAAVSQEFAAQDAPVPKGEAAGSLSPKESGEGSAPGSTSGGGEVSAKPSEQTLRLEAVGNVWVMITSGGKTVFEGTLYTGNKKTWVSDKGFVLKMGYAHGAKVYFNGKKVDAEKSKSSGATTIILEKQG